MCSYIGWDVCNTDCRSWGNYGNVVSAEYTGYHSTDCYSDWLTNTITKLGDYTNRFIFPTGMFVNENKGTTEKKNIYDVAGNVWEWTTEVSQYSTSNSVLRGGGAGHDGIGHLATYRDGNGPSMTWTAWSIGFRLVLYVK